MSNYRINFTNDYIEHRSHKYLNRYKSRNGKWIYVYDKPKRKRFTTSSGGFENGENNNQQWKSVEDSKGNELTVVKGSNSSNKYAGISIGKSKDDYNYIQKSKKVGGVEVEYDNENGTHNVTVHIDHETINRGKSAVQNILKRIGGK